jgi:hypothetical protein
MQASISSSTWDLVIIAFSFHTHLAHGCTRLAGSNGQKKCLACTEIGGAPWVVFKAMPPSADAICAQGDTENHAQDNYSRIKCGCGNLEVAVRKITSTHILKSGRIVPAKGVPVPYLLYVGLAKHQ